MLDQVFSTESKLAYVDQLVDAGITRIQVASFVHPKLVPQMADADAVCKGLKKKEGVIYSGLTLNSKGVERAINAELNHISCSISASNTHSQKNTRKTLGEAKIDFASMVKLARSNGLVVRGGVQSAFGCRYEGKIDKTHVLDLIKHHLDHGCDEIALADSTGMADPQTIHHTMKRVLEVAGDKPVILHLHNTENKGLANVYAALEAGVRYFDTAFGGLGGCPFIKSATGNIATEDTAHMLHQMGYETGVYIEKVAEVSKDVESRLGYELPGQLYKIWNQDGIKIA